MDILRLDAPLGRDLDDPVIMLAIDGWTDAGRCGTAAADTLADQWGASELGEFDSDALYDYRDRRPMLEIDRGMLGDPQWPTLQLDRIDPPGGPTLLLITGSEPDLSWRALCASIRTLAEKVGARRYIGLGSVPAPVPHTRPVRVITTGSNEELLERLGRPHERIVVPASCQVVVETALRDAGLTTLGLWARIPHYVAGEYPEGSSALLGRVGEHLDLDIDVADLDADAHEHRTRLDEAADGSSEISEHIEELERAYDSSVDEYPDQPLPTGEEIAAELQRFLQQHDKGES